MGRGRRPASWETGGGRYVFTSEVATQETGRGEKSDQPSAVSWQRLAISHWLSAPVVASDPGDEKHAAKWKQDFAVWLGRVCGSNSRLIFGEKLLLVHRPG